MTVTPLVDTVGMTGFPCPIGDCDQHPRAHRPYAKARGKNRKPSITELADMLSGGFEGAAFKASQITARYVLNNHDTLVTMEQPDAITKASRVHAAMWATDADMGTHAHTAAECFAAGQSYATPENLYEHDAERLYNFVLGLSDWMRQRQPVMLASEFIVSNDEPGYVGTGDNICLIDSEPVYVDYKTSREIKTLDNLTKYKFGGWDFQCNAICLASHHRHYHGNQLVAEIPWAETGLPRPERALILLLDHDGTFREFETPIRAEVMDTVGATTVAAAFKPAMKIVPHKSKFEPRPDAPVSVEAML